MTLEPPRLPLPHRTFAQRLRSWFFTGLVVFGPLALTVYLAWWMVSLIDNWVRPLAPASLWPDTYLPVHVPGFGVVIALVGITFLGFLAANIAGRSFVSAGEAMLDRTPVLRSVYKSLKQIFETIFREGGTQFRKVGLVEYPAKGQWSIVFISSDPPPVIAEALGEKPMISVFLPCTPNPTTGFYFYVPAEDVIELAITPNEAAQLVMSAGLIQPLRPAQVRALTEISRETARVG
ncbi:MAG: DUF502 domain-containing protein [Pseudomonadota bacterium]|nr:DUF502 domain-containing protein [Pseudomonadota bacterium]